jgi:hypothetical protein
MTMIDWDKCRVFGYGMVAGVMADSHNPLKAIFVGFLGWLMWVAMDYIGARIAESNGDAKVIR